MRYAVVIPVYNERELFPRMLDRLLNTPPPVHPETGAALERLLVVVDDASTDGSAELVAAVPERGVDAVTVLHERNRGKGAAVRSGFDAALRAGADIVLIHDADLEYDPADHAVVLAPILDGRADAVIGTRFIGQTHRVLYFWHYVANRLITLASNVLTNLNLTDIECCLKAFRREVIESITIREERFGLEPELIARIAKLRLAEGGATRRARIYEVPVSYAGRTYEEGKKITWRDGVSALRCIIRYNLLP